MIFEINAFLSSLRQSVGKEVAEYKGPNSQWRVWFLPDDPTQYKAHPRIWFNDQEPEIVIPGELRFTVSVPKDKRDTYAGVGGELSFPIESGDEGGLFSFDVHYKREHCIAGATPRIAEVLAALRAAELSA